MAETILFIVNDLPYGSETAYNAVRLAGAVAEKMQICGSSRCATGELCDVGPEAARRLLQAKQDADLDDQRQRGGGLPPEPAWTPELSQRMR